MKKRINCYLNGSDKNGKVVVFDETNTMEDVKMFCSKKFGVDTDFISLYTTKGGEIETTDEIFHDDILFITFKEDEKFKSLIPKTILFGYFNNEVENVFNNLNEDVLCIIFSFFTYTEIDQTLAIINKEWNSILKKEIFWKYMSIISYEKRRKICKNETEKIDKIINNIKKKEIDYSWKKFYFRFCEWGLNLRFDEFDHGKSISISNFGLTMEMKDQKEMYEAVRTKLSIVIPPISDVSNASSNKNLMKRDCFEWEVKIDSSNLKHEWSIVLGLEREYFSFRKSTFSNVIGYGKNNGFGIGLKNGDRLHLKANYFKNENRSIYIKETNWNSPKFKEGDIVKAKVEFHKLGGDGGTLEIFQNGISCGKAFTRIAGKIFPTISVIEDCRLTIQTIDPFE
eukprot:gene252-4498_t